tara:strand:+ start:451 stop:873 length:423 start_codon:yes stop_codon:yes gene_type:complete
MKIVISFFILISILVSTNGCSNESPEAIPMRPIVPKEETSVVNSNDGIDIWEWAYETETSGRTIYTITRRDEGKVELEEKYQDGNWSFSNLVGSKIAGQRRYQSTASGNTIYFVVTDDDQIEMYDGNTLLHTADKKLKNQ